MITTTSLAAMLGTSLAPGCIAAVGSWLAGRRRTRQFAEHAEQEANSALFDEWASDYAARAAVLADADMYQTVVELNLFDSDTPAQPEEVETEELSERAISMRMVRVSRDELADCETFAVNRMMDKSISDDAQLTALRVAELCAAIRHNNTSVDYDLLDR